jgi:hypothetical protein
MRRKMKGAQAKYRTRLSSSTALAMLHCGGESDLRCGEIKQAISPQRDFVALEVKP